MLMQRYKVTLKKKNVKNLSIRIVASDEVVLTVPLFVSKKRAFEFLDMKKEWVEKKLSQMPKPLKLEEGASINYLGYPYTIKFCEKGRAFIDGEFLYLPKDDRQNEYEKFLKKKAKEIFLPIVKSWAKKVDKEIKRVSIKKMKTRWGSCNTQKAYINLNLHLIHKPIGVIEYVVLHEIAHLTHPNHSKEFHSYVENFMPDWKEREKLLKSNF